MPAAWLARQKSLWFLTELLRRSELGKWANT
jgi:hypothetical protein